MGATVLIMIDGLRPEPLADDAERYPNLSSLRSRSSWTLSASSIMPSLTLPCHMSIFHSVPPSRHCVTSNTWVPMENPIPGLVDLAHEGDLLTAFFYTWEQLRNLTQPGSLTYSFFINEKYNLPHGDETITKEAIHYLENYKFNFLFVYFGTVDTMGEEHGWMTERYFEQVEIVDGLVGSVLNVLPADSTVLIQADHGGHDFGHGSDLPEDMTIPWMLAGPGIRSDYEIRSHVSHLETAPTLARVLGIDPHPEWLGHCIDEIFE